MKAYNSLKFKKRQFILSWNHGEGWQSEVEVFAPNKRMLDKFIGIEYKAYPTEIIERITKYKIIHSLS